MGTLHTDIPAAGIARYVRQKHNDAIARTSARLEKHGRQRRRRLRLSAQNRQPGSGELWGCRHECATENRILRRRREIPSRPVLRTRARRHPLYQNRGVRALPHCPQPSRASPYADSGDVCPAGRLAGDSTVSALALVAIVTTWQNLAACERTVAALDRLEHAQQYIAIAKADKTQQRALYAAQRGVRARDVAQVCVAGILDRDIDGREDGR